MIDEGYTKFTVDWTRGPPLAGEDIDELNAWRNKLFAAGLIGHYADLDVGYGNLSVRRSSGNEFVISGTQTGHLPMLTGAHYAIVNAFDLDANTVSCQGCVQASSESMTHAALYLIEDSIRAVVHVHSDILWRRFLDVLPTTNKGVAYGTPEMAQEFTRLYADTRFSDQGIAVMAGHDGGLISIGSSVREAASRILEANSR